MSILWPTWGARFAFDSTIPIIFGPFPAVFITTPWLAVAPFSTHPVMVCSFGAFPSCRASTVRAKATAPDTINAATIEALISTSRIEFWHADITISGPADIPIFEGIHRVRGKPGPPAGPTSAVTRPGASLGQGSKIGIRLAATRALQYAIAGGGPSGQIAVGWVRDSSGGTLPRCPDRVPQRERLLLRLLRGGLLLRPGTG